VSQRHVKFEFYKGCRKPLQYILQRATFSYGAVLILSVNASLLNMAVIGTAHIALFLLPYQGAVFSKLITGIIIPHLNQLLSFNEL